MDKGSGSEPETRKFLRCSLEELYASLSTGADGLSAAEADKRLKKYGPNVLFVEKKHILLKKILVQLRNLFNVLLIIAAILSFVTGVTAHDAGSVQMGFAILAVVVISVLFSIFQERRAERAVEAIKQLVPQNAKVQRDGQMKEINISCIVPGDIINLEEGDKVPADARVINSYELYADNSTLTGESEPQICSVNLKTISLDAGVVEYSNIVFAGTTVTSGSGTAVVLATGSNTEFGRVVAIARTIEEPPSPLEREIDHMAKLNFVVAIGIGFLFLGITKFVLNLPLTDSILFMIGVMVSLVPEGLQVTVTLSLALSSLAMSKRNVIAKRLSSVETLGSATVICTDKTGTITTGQMTVRKVWIGGSIFEVTGEGYEPEGSVFLESMNIKASDRKDLDMLCHVATLNNKATLVPPLDRKKSRWTAVGDSTEAALLVFGAKAGVQYKQALAKQPRIGLIPFQSERKMMTSVHRNENSEIIAYVKGAGNEILTRCTCAFWNGEVVPLSADMTARIREQMEIFARQAYRVLALAVRTMPGELQKYESETVEKGLTFVGLVAILDPPRHDAHKAVRKAHNAGLRVIMLTGDHELTAEAIARKVGIISSEYHVVMTGYQLAKISDRELSKVLDTQDIVFARISPEQKLRVVRALRKKGETVAVTGDGVNDTPALLEADIGIAMGISGTDVARESADMVLLDDNFASIVNGIEEGRAVFDNLKKFNVYVFTHNWAELITFIAFILLQTPLPLAVMGVLAIDLMLEIPPSLALTIEPPEPGVMERPPRKKESRIFNAGALARSGYIGLFIGILALFWCFHAWSEAGWHIGISTPPGQIAYYKGMTMVIVGIMAGQLGMLIATRTNVRSTFHLSLRRNKWLLAAVLVEIMLLVAIVYTPVLESCFRTAPLGPLDWFFLYSIVPAVILLEEGRKFVLRKYILKEKAAPSRRKLPLRVYREPEAAPGMAIKTAPPFVERAAPILLPLYLIPDEMNTVPVAMSLARNRGSRLVILRISNKKSMPSVRDELERLIKTTTRDMGIFCEFVDTNVPDSSPWTEASVESLTVLVNKKHVDTIVVPVKQNVFSEVSRSRKSITWIENFKNKEIILVSSPRRPAGIPTRPFRILIPVIHEFHQRPFDLASTLTTDSIFADVNIIAAKVIEIPRIVPLYPIYRPETLIDADEELSFLKKRGLHKILRSITPKVLMGQDASLDVAEFADERKVHMIILDGKWSEKRHGFLLEEERKIALQAKCTVVVTLPRQPQ